MCVGPDCGATEATRRCVTEVTPQGGWYGGPWLWDSLRWDAQHYEQFPLEGDKIEVRTRCQQQRLPARACVLQTICVGAGGAPRLRHNRAGTC